MQLATLVSWWPVSRLLKGHPLGLRPATRPVVPRLRRLAVGRAQPAG